MAPNAVNELRTMSYCWTETRKILGVRLSRSRDVPVSACALYRVRKTIAPSDRGSLQSDFGLESRVSYPLPAHPYIKP